MLKMSGFDVLFAGAGNLYLIFLASGIALALWKGKGWKRKTLYAVLVTAVFLAPIAPEAYRTLEYRQRLSEARAVFDERCKAAGEKIYKTVSGVNEILLVNPRPPRIQGQDEADPNWVGAGFSRESTGNQYIAEFLYFHQPAQGKYSRALSPFAGGRKGYMHVHAIEDGQHVRYSLRNPETYISKADPIESYAVRETVNSALPTYSVEYENINDPVGRRNWVAGARVKVMDKTHNQLLGEFVRFSFEPGLGSRAGFRQPWHFAVYCPTAADGVATGHIRQFVEKVLTPESN